MNAAARTIRRWRTVDIVVAATIAVAFGVVFWAWGILWNAVAPVFVAFPPAQGFMTSIWLVPGVLGGLIIRKPGAAIFCELVAALIEALLGSSWGMLDVVSGLAQSVGPELVFAVFAYRRWGLGVAIGAGAMAGLGNTVNDLITSYATWPFGWMATYGGLIIISATVVAGAGSWWLTRALARAGALTPFASARG
ncbi:MAG TPA: ECF transporter S component [Streptosporangiaceae bacterium]|jgi:energy-coupling factor transport system substrate-specific component